MSEPIYTFEWKDGDAFLALLEPEVDYTIYEDGGVPDLRVDALYVDGKDIKISNSPTVRELAELIEKDILADEWWKQEQFEEHGWRLKTRGGNDPDARWIPPRQEKEWEAA